MPAEIHITGGDITEMDLAAIVNAPNSDLIPGGGAAYHRAQQHAASPGKGLKSIAFSAVGTNIGGFPLDQRARILMGRENGVLLAGAGRRPLP